MEELNGLRSRGISKKENDMSAGGGNDVTQSISIEESKPNKKAMTQEDLD